MGKVIKAIFDQLGGNEVTTESRYQYDYGMVLKFGGAVTLPQAYEVHFALDKTGDAVTQIGGADGVTVPDSMFTSGSPIYAWVYLHDGETDGYTQYTAIIPVIKRAAPSDQEPTPVQQSAIDQAIAALGVAVEQTAADVETTTEKAAEAQASAEAAAASAAEAAETAENVEENVTAARAAKAAAEAARDRAVQAETSANQSKTAAASSETNAAASATAASASAAAALTSEENANGAMLSAYSDANRADTAADTATSAKNDAVSAKTAAQSAKTAAETAASTATTKASEAAASATTASTAASTATTKAGEAATSATNAAASAQSVASSAAQITQNAEDIDALKEDLSPLINGDFKKTATTWGNGWINGSGVFDQSDTRWVTDYISTSDIDFVYKTVSSNVYADYFNIVNGEYVFQVYKSVSTNTMYTIDKSYDAVRILLSSTYQPYTDNVKLYTRHFFNFPTLIPMVMYQGGKMNLDTINKTLTIPRRTNVFYREASGRLSYYTLSSSEDTVLDLSPYATPTVLIYFNTQKKVFETYAYNTQPDDRIHVLACVVTFLHTHTANVSVNAHYTINGCEGFIKGNNRTVFHRGYQATCPENTLPAFIMAKMMGAEWVEMDVRYTSDGVPVVLHDATINRTGRNADGTEIASTISIADITLAQAQAYDFGVYKGAIFAGTKILTFAQFMTYAKRLGLKVQIELKGDAVASSKLSELFGIVKDNGMVDNVEWVSSYSGLCIGIHNIYADANICYLGTTINDTVRDTIVDVCKTDKNNVYVGLSFSNLTSENIAYAKDNNIKIHAWTVENQNQVLNSDPYIDSFTSNGIEVNTLLYNQVVVNMP